MYTVFLVCVALIPAIALCIYIYKKDRVEKEPMGLLVLLFAMGVIICFPAAELERLIGEIHENFFSQFGTEENGKIYLSNIMFRIYKFFENFLNIALVEEGLKCLVLVLVTRKNKNFNSVFDGMIYAVFVSLGFAGFENILYVVEYGFDLAVRRAFLSVPAHMFFAVIMGYYYSFWHMIVEAKKLEKQLRIQGLISADSPKRSTLRHAVLILVMPVMAHGFFDYCLSVESSVSVIAFYVFVTFMYIYCFGKVRKLSKADCYSDSVATAWVLQRYPHLTEYFYPQDKKDPEQVNM